MKKFLTILIAILLLFSSIAVYADADYTYDVSLCYSGDAFSVDYVFGVPDGVEILSVLISDTNCFYDWNYVKSEARLYLSLASGNVIPKAKTIATVKTSVDAELSLISMKVNGKTTTNGFEHIPQDMEYVAPGYDTPGLSGGKTCSNCGIVLKEPETVPPTGPIVSAVLDRSNTLTVSGGISDNKAAEGTTYLAVYNKDNRMLALKNITELDQSNFDVPIENMKDAHTVKILRWEMLSLRPLHNAVELSVKSE